MVECQKYSGDEIIIIIPGLPKHNIKSYLVQITKTEANCVMQIHYNNSPGPHDQQFCKQKHNIEDKQLGFGKMCEMLEEIKTIYLRIPQIKF